jgi:hypothetical protein
VIGSQFKVKAISPGQIRHEEPSSSSTMSLLSCFLMSITFPVLVKRTAQPERPGCSSWAKDEAA